MENVPPLKKGPWTAEEDALLLAYVSQHGNGNWNTVQKYSGVARCGKSCRLRWTNHLRPNLKKCPLTPQEERLIIEQHALLGNRWSRISAMLHGRTDNEVKNFWNTRMKRLLRAGQPLYPPDIIPVARARSQKRDSEHSADEGAVSLSFSGDVPVDSSTFASSLKSMTASTQKSLKGEKCPVEVTPDASQAYLSLNGPKSKSSTDGDEGGFSLTRGTHITGGTNMLNPNTYENAVSGFRCPMQVPLNSMPQNIYGGPLYHLPPNMSQQPEREVRHLYDHNLERSGFVYQGFPYDPEPPDRTLSPHGLPRGGVSFGVDLGSKQSTVTSSCNFSTPRHEIPCLKVELPSVQLAESADSSSSLSSPFSASQSLPLSEVDSFGSPSNECTTKSGGSLLDVLLQQNGSSSNVLSAEMVEHLLVVTSNNASPRISGPPSFQNASRLASTDPLSLLGGRSLTLFGDDFKVTSENSSSIQDPQFAFHIAAGKDNSNLKFNEQVLPPLNMKTEGQSTGPCADEELDILLAFEKPDGYALYDERAHSGTLSNHQEEFGHSGGLEAIFGQNANVDLEQLAAMSCIGNMWELGSCAWNSMPGAL